MPELWIAIKGRIGNDVRGPRGGPARLLEEMEMSADWMMRPLPDSFFDEAGKHNEMEVTRLFEEIPMPYKSLAYMMIVASSAVADSPKMSNCFEFRHLLYLLYKQLLEKDTDVELPHYWYADGVMINPEWIVRITNGIIGWVCDDNREHCLMKGMCRYYPADIGGDGDEHSDSI